MMVRLGVCCSIFLLMLCEGDAQQAIEILPTDPDDWLSECFKTYQDNCCRDENHIKYSNHILIEKPSGLCMDSLACSFERCNASDALADVFQRDLTGLTFADIQEDLGVPLSLPSFITFPKTAGDVVEAVKYARDNDLKVSIKSTGHSYAGQSIASGSLHLNLRSLKQYTPDGVVECSSTISIKAEDQAACTLAEARGKQAFIKVGGGEVWSNVYLAVIAAAEQASTKYDVVGGGAGSVGAAGGWLQGGGWSYGAERLYGLGSDQVLEFEMVLANGQHVRFGPTQWEDAPGYLYPKTLEVTGFCNTNTEAADETEWVWESCNEDIPFADLWYAVRGGGGGTYGVVTALKYQLHVNRPLEVIFLNQEVVTAIETKTAGNSDLIARAAGLYGVFLVYLLFNPTAIGLDEETSIRCGSPALLFNFFLRGTLLFCHDNVFSGVVNDAWKSLVDSDAENVFVIAEDLKNLMSSAPVPSYPEVFQFIPRESWMPADKIPDDPPPSLLADRGVGGWCSAQVPISWLKEASPEELMTVFLTVGGEHTTGGNAQFASDQMTAVTDFQRQTGLSSVSLRGLSTDMQESLLSKFLKDSIEDSASHPFPGITEVNHLCPESFGPLKSDYSKLCPESWTLEQKEAECISIQESIWGTTVLTRLEEIKLAVDPDSLFDCYACVKPKKVPSPAPVSASPTTGALPTTVGDPTPAPVSGGMRLVVTGNIAMSWLVLAWTTFWIARDVTASL